MERAGPGPLADLTQRDDPGSPPALARRNTGHLPGRSVPGAPAQPRGTARTASAARSEPHDVTTDTREQRHRVDGTGDAQADPVAVSGPRRLASVRCSSRSGSPATVILEIAVGGGVPDRVEVAGQHHTAAVDDDDVLAQVLDDVELVAGEQHAGAATRDVAEQPGHRVHRDRVQPGERLVEHQQVGRVHQRGGELDPLLVAV